MPGSPNILSKNCCVCGTNVASSKRWKDGHGNYYCDPCWTGNTAARNPAVAPMRSDGDDDEPPALAELAQLAVASQPAQDAANTLRCAGCGEQMPWDQAHENEGKPYCFSCVVKFARPTREIVPTTATRGASSPSYDLIETRRCPFCNEEIQVEAKKCKHCGEWLERKAGAAVVNYAHRAGTQRTAGAARSYLNPAVLTLILYVVGFGIVGLIVNIAYLSSAKRTECETGETPEGKGCLVALLWVFVGIPLIVVALWVMAMMVTDMRR